MNRAASVVAIFILSRAMSPIHAYDSFSVSREQQAVFETQIQALLKSHCVQCHGPEKPKGGIRFDAFDPNRLSSMDTETLALARDALSHQKMPPKEADKPLSVADRKTLLDWIEGALIDLASQKRLLDAQPQIRRLSKREYNYTLQAIFNAPSDFHSLLPPDPISEAGYDTAHALLMISQVDLKIYLETARIALEKFLNLGVASGEKECFFIELEDVYHHCRGVGESLAKKRAPTPVSKSEFSNLLEAHQRVPITYRDRKYGPLPFGNIPEGVVEGVDEGIGFARLHSQFLLIKTKQRAGEVVVRVHAAATQGADGSYPRMRLESGRRSVQNLKVINAGEFDVVDPLSKPGVYAFRFRLENALPIALGSAEDKELEHLFFAISNVARNENGILAASPEGQEDLGATGKGKAAGALLSQAKSAAKQTEVAIAAWDAAQTNFLHLDAIEVEILPAHSDPLNPWNLPTPGSLDAEHTLANNSLDTFLPKVFRRPLTKVEHDRYRGLYLQQRESGQDFKTALTDTFAAAMISPSFLYIGKPAEGLEHADSLAYASKLAYFLWASPPDERLVGLATSGKLNDRAVLANEIDRMLDDPKSKRLSATFAEQWLGLRRLSDVQIDYEQYPDYGPELAALTKRQTVETFQDRFHADSDARQLFRSDSTLLNDLLARHYGLPPVEGGELRRIPTPQSKQVGGILTHASILAMNSDGKQSHPVKRGAWLLDRILSDTPPPPPPAVPDLDPNSANTKHLSLKDRIELHRQQNGCINCHEKIDPWGVAFEEFDATGRWRDTRSALFPIDSTTRLPDGTELSGAADLADYLLNVKEAKLMTAIAKGLMTYASGSELDILDEAEVNQVSSAFRTSGYSLKTLCKAVAQTAKFDETFNRTHSSEH